MQPFEIIDRKTKAFVRMYVANSRAEALEMHYSELGRFDGSVRAIGPKEGPPSRNRREKPTKAKEVATAERPMQPVRWQQHLDGRGVGSGRRGRPCLPVRSRQPAVVGGLLVREPECSVPADDAEGSGVGGAGFGVKCELEA